LAEYFAISAMGSDGIKIILPQKRIANVMGSLVNFFGIYFFWVAVSFFRKKTLPPGSPLAGGAKE
jgi:hypothetical protein